MAIPQQYDFSGYATRANVKCSDGRVISSSAFKHLDGKKVPLVWNHQHNDPKDILGSAYLEHRDDGMYAYCEFNNNPDSVIAKGVVQHGNVESLSIYANRLKHNGNEVVHGMIREVSIVLAGANPGAFIENIIRHGDDTNSSDEGIVYNDCFEIKLFGDEAEPTDIHDDEVTHKENASSTTGSGGKIPNKEQEAKISTEWAATNKADRMKALKNVTNWMDEHDIPSEWLKVVNEFLSTPLAEMLSHSDETVMDVLTNMTAEKQEVAMYLIGEAIGAKADPVDIKESSDEEPLDVNGIWDKFTEKEQKAVHSAIMEALDESDEADEADEADEKEEGDEMKHGHDVDVTNDSDTNNNNTEGEDTMKDNAFDQNTKDVKSSVLSHSDQVALLTAARNTRASSFRAHMEDYICSNETIKDSLQHGWTDITELFPDYKLLQPGAPENVMRDVTWATHAMNRAHKSPMSRIKTRQNDLRDFGKTDAKGYKKGDQKAKMGNMKLVSRTTDPQTVYIHDTVARDDMLDITDLDIVQYQYGIMDTLLREEIMLAAMVGDGRDDGDQYKIKPEHIRPIWTDDELYTIHNDIDLVAMKAELQGSDTSVYYGENYIFAEALITARLYASETYRGSGAADMYITPHNLNKALLSRDRNGHRMYRSVTDFATAMNVQRIFTAEQFEGLTRKTDDATPKTKELVALIVNMNDYNFGSTKGGQVSSFNDFDIDFNQYKYLMETRLSGALTRIKSAIALELDVTPEPPAGG